MAGVRQLELLHEIPGRARWRCTLSRPEGWRGHVALEAAVGALAGVKQVRWNERISSLVVAFDKSQTDTERLVLSILKLPAKSLFSDSQQSATTKEAPSVTPVIKSAMTTLATQLFAQPLKFPISFASVIPVLKEGAQDFQENGINSHVLEAAAVLISLFRQDYFTANTTAFMLALGEYLEESIQHRSDVMLRDLLVPSNERAWVLKDGVEQQLPIAEIEVSDIVIVSTGELIPIDGTVVSGEAMINEATLTGESVPVRRGHKDKVYSGTLVQEGRLNIYAEYVGENAAIARIADFVQRALESRSDIQLEAAALADRLVPLVLGLSGLTYMMTGDWRRVAAVLQADYSCALKLSTPVAFKSAMYEAGRHGVLIKNATALEGFARADTFVFDKTGTLSTGQLEVTDVIALSNRLDEDDVLNMAASVEEHSIHPIAEAVVRAAQALGEGHHHFDHKEVEFVVAHGVHSVIQGRRIVVGSRHYIEEHEEISLIEHDALIDGLRKAGKALLYIAWGGELMGIIALRDGIRDNAMETLARLRKAGVKRFVMLSGDHPERAESVGKELGMDEIHGGLMPEDKSRILKELADNEANIVFIGDGVNDAPALSSAAVGVSMHLGADVARLAADVVLLEDDLSKIADVRELSLITDKLIRSNFRLTAGLNTAILLAAAAGQLQPVATSVLHNGTTIGILLRALLSARLKRAKTS